MLSGHFRAISIGFESPENQFMPVVQVLSPKKKIILSHFNQFG
jgi:hypothetical protein